MTFREGVFVLTALAAGWGLAGCTQTARNDYTAVGANLKEAAKDTALAIETDADHAKQTVQEHLRNIPKAEQNSEVSSRVQSAISDQDLQIRGLTVDAHDQVVTLRGTIGSEVENQVAEKAARQAAGDDYSIDDKLEVGNP